MLGCRPSSVQTRGCVTFGKIVATSGQPKRRSRHHNFQIK